jgi:pyruvate ferredoxin oxidoreductase gamma subunit/2-oxoisovalerate ferredoxin oxidoreductase gamma subunit
VVASILMAKALFRAGHQVQSFPVFGVERRGAPVEAYLRVDRKKILLRCNLYSPDTVVVLDARLMGTDAVLKGLKPEGSVLVNAPTLPAEADRALLAGRRVCCVDATRIAIRRGLGTRTHPMANTAMCGALARLLDTPPFEDLAAVIEQELALHPEKNVAAAREAFEAAVPNETVLS